MFSSVTSVTLNWLMMVKCLNKKVGCSIELFFSFLSGTGLYVTTTDSLSPGVSPVICLYLLLISCLILQLSTLSSWDPCFIYDSESFRTLIAGTGRH